MDASLFCSTIYGIKNPEILREINDAAVIENVSKGTVLIRAGEPQTRIVFLMEGVFRGSFLTSDADRIFDGRCLSRFFPEYQRKRNYRLHRLPARNGGHGKLWV